MGTLWDLFAALDAWETESIGQRIDPHPDETLAELARLRQDRRYEDAVALIASETHRLRPLVRGMKLGAAELVQDEPGHREFVLPEYLAELHLTAARLRAVLGDNLAARDELVAALTLTPEDDTARYVLIELYEEAGDYMDALALLERLVQEHPDASHPMFELAAGIERRGDRDAAHHGYERVRALDRTGLFAELADRRESAGGQLPAEKALASRYDDAVRAFADHDHQAAVAAFGDVLAWNTRHHQSWFGLGWAYQEIAGTTRTVDAPGSHVVTWTVDEEQRETLDRAMQAYRLAVLFGPHDETVAEAHHQLAMCLLAAGRPADALAPARAALALAPEDGGVLSDMAGIVLACGAFGEAAELARRALERQPGNPSALVTLARALYSTGQVEELSEKLDDVLAAIATLTPRDADR